MRAFGHRVQTASQRLSAQTRVLESVSYKAVLERGFALVKASDGAVRRRASSVKSGEVLTLSFADGEARAVAEGGSPRAPSAKLKPAKVNQGDLF